MTKPQTGHIVISTNTRQTAIDDPLYREALETELWLVLLRQIQQAFADGRAYWVRVDPVSAVHHLRESEPTADIALGIQAVVALADYRDAEVGEHVHNVGPSSHATLWRLPAHLARSAQVTKDLLTFAWDPQPLAPDIWRRVE